MEKLQPKLRFPEFKDEWKNQSLKSIGEIIGGGTPSTTIDEYWNGEINWFTPSEITSKYISSSKRKITYLGVNKSSAKILPKGSILLTTRATIGESSICLEESTTNQGFQSIVVNHFNNNEFIYYLIKTLKNELIKNSSGSTFLEISKRKIELINNYFPSLEEQTKIAEFLGSVDKQLELLNTKKEKLNLYKKGVMQQLFSQQLRFKDYNGNDYPDWEEKTLEEIIKFRNGKGHEKVIDPNGKFVVVNSKYISTDGVVSKYTNELISPLFKNDIVMVMSDLPNGKALGKCLLIDKDNFYTLNQRICALTPDYINNNSIFLKYIINRNNYFLKFDDGVNQTNLKKDEVLNCPLNIPSKEEQTKIANFLSAIDKQIESVETEINKTETYKKGLLQQMFV